MQPQKRFEKVCDLSASCVVARLLCDDVAGPKLDYQLKISLQPGFEPTTQGRTLPNNIYTPSPQKIYSIVSMKEDPLGSTK